MSQIDVFKSCTVCGQRWDFSDILMNVHCTSQRLHRGSKWNSSLVKLFSPHRQLPWCLIVAIVKSAQFPSATGLHWNVSSRWLGLMLSEASPFHHTTTTSPLSPSLATPPPRLLLTPTSPAFLSLSPPLPPLVPESHATQRVLVAPGRCQPPGIARVRLIRQDRCEVRLCSNAFTSRRAALCCAQDLKPDRILQCTVEQVSRCSSDVYHRTVGGSAEVRVSRQNPAADSRTDLGHSSSAGSGGTR